MTRITNAVAVAVLATMVFVPGTTAKDPILEPRLRPVRVPSLSKFPGQPWLSGDLEGWLPEKSQAPGEGVIQSVRDVALRWDKPVVTVAFRGGDEDLRRAIAEVAVEWTRHGRLVLDFGHQAGAGFREWSTSEAAHAADIRVDFTEPGYWSYIGRESVSQDLIGQASMSLQDFDFPDQRPRDWRDVVLHEFGHALGFRHEHQSPEGGCDDHFRWDNQQGYRVTLDRDGAYVADDKGRQPGLYLQLGGPPNHWDRWKIDFSLRQIRDSRMLQNLDASPFDDRSIMLYRFERGMFLDDACFHKCDPEGVECGLSEQDKRAFAKQYPRDLAARARIETLQSEAVELLASPKKQRSMQAVRDWVEKAHRGGP